MKYFLKALVIASILLLSFLLGYYFLDYSELWTVALFAFYCWATGKIAYKLFRIIDKRWSI